jgi:hypothetical protein
MATNDIVYVGGFMGYDPITNCILFLDNSGSPIEDPTDGFWHDLNFVVDKDYQNANHIGNQFLLLAQTSSYTDPSVILADQQQQLTIVKNTASNLGRVFYYWGLQTINLGWESSSSDFYKYKTEIYAEYAREYRLSSIDVTNDGTSFTNCTTWSQVKTVLDLTDQQLQQRTRYLKTRVASAIDGLGFRFGNNWTRIDTTGCSDSYPTKCGIEFDGNLLDANGGYYGWRDTIMKINGISTSDDNIYNCNIILRGFLPPFLFDRVDWRGTVSGVNNSKTLYRPHDPYIDGVHFSVSNNSNKIFI